MGANTGSNPGEEKIHDPGPIAWLKCKCISMFDLFPKNVIIEDPK